MSDGKPTSKLGTKYGTAAQLKDLIGSLHNNGLSAQADLVPNQFLGLDGKQAVLVTRTDSSGNAWHANGMPQISKHVYIAYSQGGGKGQAKYGSDGFKSWDAADFNGTSLQKQGMARAVLSFPDFGVQESEYKDPEDSDYLTVDTSGATPKLNDSRGVTNKWYKFDVAKSQLNLVNSAIPGDKNISYFSADGWYSLDDSSGKVWVPYLINSTSFQNWISEKTNWNNFFDPAKYPADPKEIAATLATLVSQGKDLNPSINAYMATEPGYGVASEQPTFTNDKSGIDDNDQLLFVDRNGNPTSKKLNDNFSNRNELLVGTDVDNSDPRASRDPTLGQMDA